MYLAVERLDDVVIVRPRVELMDAAAAAELVARLPDAVGGARQLVLDLSHTAVVDGGGLLGLCACLERVAGAGLCGLPARALAAARLLGITGRLTVWESAAEALRALGFPRAIPLAAAT